VPGQRGDQLQADRAGFTGPQVLGQRVGGVRLVRRVPGGAGLSGLLLGRPEVEDERVVRSPLGRQILLLRLQPGGEGALLLVSTDQRLHVSLFGQRAARPFGLIFGLGRGVGLLGAGRDPLVGGGDPVGQARHAGRHADGGQQPAWVRTASACSAAWRASSERWPRARSRSSTACLRAPSSRTRAAACSSASAVAPASLARCSSASRARSAASLARSRACCPIFL
jgi:hypothetical protein